MTEMTDEITQVTVAPSIVVTDSHEYKEVRFARTLMVGGLLLLFVDLISGAVQGSIMIILCAIVGGLVAVTGYNNKSYSGWRVANGKRF